MNSKQRLVSRFLEGLPPGELTWIGVRPAKYQSVISMTHTRALINQGLEGDHRIEKAPGSGRQVTIISEEYISQISHFLGGKTISPEQLRRNLVVKSINLMALRYQQFQIGEAIFEAGALCDPCVRMEKALGKGGVAAMLGHGGLCCKVIKGGKIQLGDTVEIITPQQSLF